MEIWHPEISRLDVRDPLQLIPFGSVMDPIVGGKVEQFGVSDLENCRMRLMVRPAYLLLVPWISNGMLTVYYISSFRRGDHAGDRDIPANLSISGAVPDLSLHRSLCVFRGRSAAGGHPFGRVQVLKWRIFEIQEGLCVSLAFAWETERE